MKEKANVYRGILKGFILDPDRKTVTIKLQDGENSFTCTLRGQHAYDNFVKLTIPILHEGDDLHISQWKDKEGNQRALFAVFDYQEPSIAPMDCDATIALHMKQDKEKNDPDQISDNTNGD